MKVWIFLIGAVFGAATFAFFNSFFDRADSEILAIEETVPVSLAKSTSDSSIVKVESNGANATSAAEKIIEWSGGDQVNHNSEVSETANWSQRKRGELESDPKDIEWAYFNEQAILQFLANHPKIGNFDISYIECRTTTCQIEVYGFDDTTGPIWHQLMYDLNQQPWAEFGERGNSFANDEGRFVIIQALRRLEAPD